MLTTNPFAEIAAFISPGTMQAYLVLMVIFVIGGTILDMVHKKSAKYFFENSEKAKKAAKREVNGGEKVSMAVQTLTNEVLTSGEFENPKRRISHLLMMYGFILFVLSTVVMVASGAGGIWSLLWHLGALMICVGGYWFWFAIRVDVRSEGKKWYKLVRADLFIVSLLMMATFALLWSITGSLLLFWIFILATTVLFTTVLWSKFAHMFFKPAAAFQKRVTRADGSRENLPEIPDLSSAETHERYPDILEYMGKNPGYMGLGIKREPSNHY